MFGQSRNIKQKSGNQIKFRRYSSLAVNTTPLAEGVTPAGQQLSVTDLYAEVKQYGDFVHLTDVIDLTVQDPVLTEAAELISESMGSTIDRVVRDILAQTASMTVASSGANGDNPTEFVSGDFDGIIQTLLNNNAKPIREIVEATDGVGTRPVREAYFAIAHTENFTALEDLNGWQPVNEYSRPNEAMEHEFGSYKNIRFLLTSVGYKEPAQSGGGRDVYRTLVMGRDAYGCTEIEGAAKTIVKGYGSGGTGDPLDQRASLGYKCFFTARILNDSFMHSLRHT